MIRLFDIFFSIVGIIFLSPVLIVASIILLFTGEHKVIYAQKRVGKAGEEFYLYKFATMLENSPNMTGGFLTQDKDPRVLPFGNYLRRTKVNELPQIINILKGDMSFVGPRPQAKVHFDLFSAEQKQVIKNLSPGLTGVGSLFFRNEDVILKESGKDYDYFHDHVITPYKGELELWYALNQSFLTYIKVIYLTAALIINKNYKVISFFENLPEAPEELSSVIDKIENT